MYLSCWRRCLEGTGLSVEKRGLGDGLAHDVPLDEVWQPDLGLVFEVDGCGDGEDLCIWC